MSVSLLPNTVLRGVGVYERKKSYQEVFPETRLRKCLLGVDPENLWLSADHGCRWTRL